MFVELRRTTAPSGFVFWSVWIDIGPRQIFNGLYQSTVMYNYDGTRDEQIAREARECADGAAKKLGVEVVEVLD